MRFRYSIARYMPSIVRGEFVNIGVVLEDQNGRVAGRFLSNLSRARHLYPDADLATLRLVVDHFSKLYAVAQRPSELRSTADLLPSLDQLVRDNQCDLSFSEPRVTLGEDMADELEDLYSSLVSQSRARDQITT